MLIYVECLLSVRLGLHVLQNRSDRSEFPWLRAPISESEVGLKYNELLPTRSVWTVRDATQAKGPDECHLCEDLTRSMAFFVATADMRLRIIKFIPGKPESLRIHTPYSYSSYELVRSSFEAYDSVKI